MAGQLNQDDIQQLLQNPSEEARANIATKLGGQVDKGVLSSRERDIAHAIMRTMMRDAAVRVREALSKSLAHSDEIPHDVALTLAEDIDDVALPMLEASNVLTDEDLISIIRSSGPSKQVAIANRENVTASVSSQLVETNNTDVVRALVSNESAQIADDTLEKIVDRHGDDETIQAPMVNRPRLPVTVAERLVTMVSDQLKARLVEQHHVSPRIAGDLTTATRERATIDLLAGDHNAEDMAELIQHLKESGRLSASVVLRAACTGDMEFVEEAFACLAEVPVSKARVLIHDGGSLGFEAVYKRAGFPEAFYDAFRVALDVFHTVEFDGGDNDRQRFERRMMERVLTQYDEMNVEDLDFFLNKLNQMALAS
jgi:uncharacterized protein (DUF2336 family)